MATYIETLKRGDNQIVPRTVTQAIVTGDGDALDDVLEAKYEKPSGGIPLSDLASDVFPVSSTISLPAASWTGSASPYSQVVSITGITSTSRIDLQPTPAQLASLMDDDITLTCVNNDGTVTVYAIGNKPTENLEIQIIITSVGGGTQ